ncbi:hypothetical protein [Streptomyces sp. NBC_01428]|uniref:hypothetical protein n=1 Tax=Streptomyces sp. NBC_01428 TaxID=2903861 RepID=UPI002E307CAE|nr:hypothetical protein [Streptomyces sp. NBC_01428]
MQNQGEGHGCFGALLGIVLWISSAFFLSPLVGLLTVIGVGVVGLAISSRGEVDHGVIRGLSNVSFILFALLFLVTLADDPLPDRLAGSSFGTSICCLVMFGVFGASQKRG